MQHVESDSLTVDNFEASQKATRHLIEHGHKNIVCVADDERIYTKTERVAGYSRAMKDARLPPRVCLVGAMTGSVPDQLSFVLNSTLAHTEIFAPSNHVGIDVLRDLQRRSIEIPREIALICFDDFSAATLVTPAITVVQQPVAELGHRAAQLMLARLKMTVMTPPSRVVLPTKLVIRKSCGC